MHQKDAAAQVLHCPEPWRVVSALAYAKWPYYTLLICFVTLDALMPVRFADTELVPSLAMSQCIPIADIIQPQDSALQCFTWVVLMVLVGFCVEYMLHQYSVECFPEEPSYSRCLRVDAASLVLVFVTVVSGYMHDNCRFLAITSTLLHVGFLLVFLDFFVPLLGALARILPQRFTFRPVFRSIGLACITAMLVVLHALVHGSYDHHERVIIARVTPLIISLPLAVFVYLSVVYSALSMRRSPDLVVLTTDTEGASCMRFGLAALNTNPRRAPVAARNKRQ